MVCGVAATLAAVFERAPALVETLVAGGPGGSTGEIIERARARIAAMSDEEKIAVLDAHPRIGADPAGLSAASRHEQGDDAEPALLAELATLNDAYERRFGFRFVVFVNGRPKRELVPVLRARLGRTREEELTTGLEEFLAIARARLEDRC